MKLFISRLCLFSSEGISVETCKELFDRRFPYLELTEEGKNEIYGIEIKPPLFKQDVSVFIDNSGLRPSGSFSTCSAWMNQGKDNGSIVGNPLFTNPPSDGYSLQPNSPTFPTAYDFNDIHFSRIGCYDREERRTWPLIENTDRWPKKPILHQISG
jgi:hypothetical protein